MKFTPHPEGEKAYAQLLPGHPGMRMFKASAGDWNFVITYDRMHGIWTATWGVRNPVAGKRYSAQNCEDPEPGKKFKPYDSQHQAEQACFRKYRQLRAEN